jgi:hypothetical protein
VKPVEITPIMERLLLAIMLHPDPAARTDRVLSEFIGLRTTLTRNPLSRLVSAGLVIKQPAPPTVRRTSLVGGRPPDHIYSLSQRNYPHTLALLTQLRAAHVARIAEIDRILSVAS